MISTVYYDIPNGIRWLSRWKKNCVDNVYYTIVGRDVCHRYLSVVDEYTIGIDGNHPSG